MEHLEITAADGEAANTGKEGGMHRKIELKTNKKLDRQICDLHRFLSLELKKVYNFCNGKTLTRSGTEYNGPIGKFLEKVNNKPVIKFKPIEVDYDLDDLPLDTWSDQLYLAEITKIISIGICPEKFASRKCGPLNQARWLTAGNRALRHYISTPEPSRILQLLTEFIVKVSIYS